MSPGRLGLAALAFAATPRASLADAAMSWLPRMVAFAASCRPVQTSAWRRTRVATSSTCPEMSQISMPSRPAWSATSLTSPSMRVERFQPKRLMRPPQPVESSLPRAGQG